ncbi:hypothetical protein [Gemmobacter lutimaris]|uniref:hypothetical protein n=1 Tax=Gemmobacter lutimaris TaxID=2306023 RepID=UPI001314A2CE|nr:hypothetical protein [Gemmobacter lutimaris]
MTTEMLDGQRVLKLRDHAGHALPKADDMLAMVHLWRLISGGHALRDITLAPRRFL